MRIAQPERASPAAAGSPTDRWARRWAAIMAALLVVWFLLPTNPISKGDDTWSWSDLADRSSAYSKIEILLPVVVAAAVLAARGTRAARAVWIAGGLALVLGLGVVGWIDEYFRHRDLGRILERVPYSVGVVAVAAVGGANHVRKRRPESSAARWVGGIGGVYVAVLSLVSALLFVRDLQSGGTQAQQADLRGLWLAYLSAFGLLGALGLRRETRLTTRARVLGWMAVGLPALYFLLSLVSIGRDYPDHGFAWFLREMAWVFRKQACSTCGAILLAVGIASWIDGRLPARARASARGSGPHPAPSAAGA